MQLDDTLAEAHAALGHAKLFYEWDMPGAGVEFQQAVRLNPSYATAHQWYALYLTAQERHAEAIVQIQLAREIDPLSLIINTHVGFVFYHAQRYDEAIAQCRRTLELDPNIADAHYILGLALGQQGKYDEALAELQIAARLNEPISDVNAALAYFYAVSGRRAESEKILTKFQQAAAQEDKVPAHYLAIIYTGLGDYDNAVTALQTAVKNHWYAMIYLRVDPIFDPLRSNREYLELLSQMSH